MVWVGEADLPGRLQDESIITSHTDIEKSLKVFKFVIISSYNEHSPAASCDWGVFVSATWGRT
jgi:hypothetical protein